MAKSANSRATGQTKSLAQKYAKQKSKYAPEPSAEEYKTFPPGYRLEHGSWPVEAILEVKGAQGPERKRKYLVQWKPHPYTLQDFEPTWVGRGEITQDLLDDWNKQLRLQLKHLTTADNTEKDNVRGSRVASVSDRSHVQPRNRRLSAGASKDSVSEEYIPESSIRRLRRQKNRRIISDEDTQTQASKPGNSQQTASAGTSSLQSPPPEIEDSQEALHRQTATISVVVPPGPSDSQREQFILISSGQTLQSSSQIPISPEIYPSGNPTASDYPTPDSEQVQSPAISDTSSGCFYLDIAQSTPSRSSLIPQIQTKALIASLANSRRASEILASQINSSGRARCDFLLRTSASGVSFKDREAWAAKSLPPAREDTEITSPVHDYRASSENYLATSSPIADSRTRRIQQCEKLQPQLPQDPLDSPPSCTAQPSQISTAISDFKTQISPIQRQKQRLFQKLHWNDIESRSNQGQQSTQPRLQSPLRVSQPSPDQPGRPGLAQPNIEGPLSPALLRPITSSPTAMTAPSNKSSPITGTTSTSSRISSGTAMTFQEQFAQSRAFRQRNAASISPIEVPTKAPAIPQIREPMPVQLTARTSNSILSKEQLLETESLPAMQSDRANILKDSRSAAKPDGVNVPLAPSLHIQQSIELDESGKADHISQDSSVLDPKDVEESGHVNSSGQGLMPNYPILLSGEFAIPLHAEGKTQDAYRNAVQLKQKAMSKYLRRGSSSSAPSSGLVTPKTEANEMVELVGRLDAIVSLLDLGYEGMLTQSSFSGTQLAKWAVKASSKFAFIKTLIDALQLYECSLIIFARAGQTQQLFQHFLSTFDIDFYTHTGAREAAHSPTWQGKVTVHLIAEGQRPRLKLKRGPSLIIAFDNSYDPRSEYVLDLRGEGHKQVPVIHLLVSNSSEHIERCLPVNMPSPQRNRLLIQTIVQGSRNMGKILSEMNEATLEYYSLLSGGTRIVDDDLMRREQIFQKMPDFHLKRLAQQVGKALIDGEFGTTWSTVPPMPSLELDEISGLITQQLRLPSPSPMPASPGGTPSFRKRLLDSDVLETTGGSKRQRMTPVPGTSPYEHGEAAQIHHLQHALEAAKDEAASEKLARMGAEDARDRTKSQLNEWRQSVSGLQKRVEYHRDRDHKARTKIKHLTKDIERSNQLRERNASECDALKLQNTQLREELAGARKALVESGGDVAALEVAQAEARTASTALAKAEKDLASAKQQGEYFRIQYQETMATGRQHQADAEELQAKVKGLEIDASDEKRRLKLVNFDDAANAHIVRIEKLELENKALESMVRKLNTENVGLRASRGVITRASSVQPPGSPRPREARSRAGSPVPGLSVAGHSGSRASALRHER